MRLHGHHGQMLAVRRALDALDGRVPVERGRYGLEAPALQPVLAHPRGLPPLQVPEYNDASAVRLPAEPLDIQIAGSGKRDAPPVGRRQSELSADDVDN